MMKDLATVNAELQEQKDRADNTDFKMVTFSLAGKDYGVDIMNVKEIAKADKFTYVPNAASFVRGVYNLRGDIIPIIDLRTFFHMSIDRKGDGQENMLILRIEDHVYGTIVDKIDKVVAINSSTIQPPHPIFGDINIKFISGVVEKLGDLYIILDVLRIFSQNEEDKQKPRTPIPEAPGETFFVPPAVAAEPGPVQQPAVSDSAFGFVRDTLAALRHFSASALNERWLQRRFNEWCSSRAEADIQLKNTNEADEFLSTFYSPSTGSFWEEDYAAAVKAVLPDMPSNSIQVWNLGCGKGYEAFSFACVLKSRYPDGHLKIWANDNDILAISNAPNMVFDLDDVPEYARGFMSRGKNGYSFSQAIKEAVTFEYHDVLNGNVLPEVDIILVRDLLSFFTAPDQDRLIADFSEKLKKQGVIIMGRNEELPSHDWQSIARDPLSAFMRN